MTRNAVLRKCYAARTLAQIEEAKTARGQWLRDHPEDTEMLELGGRLSKLADAIRITDVSEPAEPMVTAAA